MLPGGAATNCVVTLRQRGAMIRNTQHLITALISQMPGDIETTFRFPANAHVVRR
jgi:hypothetical protein